MINIQKNQQILVFLFAIVGRNDLRFQRVNIIASRQEPLADDRHVSAVLIAAVITTIEVSLAGEDNSDIYYIAGATMTNPI